MVAGKKPKSRILAVDDNPRNLEIVSEALSESYDVRLVSSAREALKIATSFVPDVFLLDIMMPEMDGLTLCSLLRRNCLLQNSRSIIMSAKGGPIDRRNGISYGAHDYLVKPFTEEELIAKVESMLEVKRLAEGSDLQEELSQFVASVDKALTIIANIGAAESSKHLMRIRSITELLARRLLSSSNQQRLGDRFISCLVHASVYHDIGMIAFQDPSAPTEGAASEVQRERTKQHTIVGEKILRQLGSGDSAHTAFFTVAGRIARWHHEKWDGTGYPDGLQGREIPLEARILSLAHAIEDELCLQLCTNSTIDAGELADTIEERSGTDFDPMLVSVLRSVIGEVVGIHNL